MSYPFPGRQDDWGTETDAFIVCKIPKREAYLFVPNIIASKINIGVQRYHLWFNKWFQFYKYIYYNHECVEVFQHHILSHYVNIRLINILI